MRTIPRLVVVAAIAVAPFVVGATPASACSDPEGRCLVNCVNDIIMKGYCRL